MSATILPSNELVHLDKMTHVSGECRRRVRRVVVTYCLTSHLVSADGDRRVVAYARRCLAPVPLLGALIASANGRGYPSIVRLLLLIRDAACVVIHL